MPTDGLLTEVLIAERGSHAAAVALPGALEIQVADVTDFTDYTTEDTTDPDTGETTGIGIVIDILGERYTVDTVTTGATDDTVTEGAGETYDLAADLTPGTLKLTEALRVQVDEDDPVWLVVGDAVATDAYALVSFPQTAEVVGETSDAGDVAHVPIAYGQRASFPEGAYEPAVPIVVTDDLSGVLDVPGTKPSIDGSTIINLPPPEDVSDGLPPAASPTPVVYSGLGSLQVRWTGITNADPVRYRVYLSTLDQFPPAEAAIIADTTNTMITISADSDGNRLVYGQPYYVSVQAYDADGPADPSPLVAGNVMQVTNDDIAAEFVYAGQIIANQIVGGEVTSPLVLSSSIKTGTAGARVEVDGTGIAVYDSTGTPVALIPTEGTAIFRGDAEIGDLTLVGGATLRGSTEVSRSAYIVLADKVSPSRSAPSLSNTWDSHPTTLVIPDSSQGDTDLADLPESWYGADGWSLQGIVTDDCYTRHTWWGAFLNQYGNVQNLLFTSLSIEGTFADPGNPLAARFEGDVYEDELLAASYSGDAPAETGGNAEGYYLISRYNGKTYLNWAPLGYYNEDGTGTRIRKECRLPDVGNFKWVAVNIKPTGSIDARIYGAVRNSNGTVALNRWDPDTSAVTLVSITNPGAESNWDSKWGRAGSAAGTGALVEDGNYIKLSSTAASGTAAYTIGEKIDIPVIPGDRITAANAVWPGSSSLLGKTGMIQIFWWNSSGANIGYVEAPFTFPSSSAWVAPSVEGTAPAGAVRMSMRVYFTATAIGQTIYGGTTAIAKAGGLDAPVETLTLNTGAAITELLGLTVAKGDFSDYRILILERTGAVATARAFTLAGARVAADDFPLPTTGVTSVFWNEDTSWWETVDTNGVTYKHENGTKAYDKLYASFTWKRGTQYESAQSAVATFTNKRRAKVVITIPPKVITGAADDPDSAGIYLGQGATTPPRTGMYLAATITGTSLIVTSPTFTGVNPPDPLNNPKDFPSAIPGRVYSTVADTLGPLIDLKGSGEGRLGNLKLLAGSVNLGRVNTWLMTAVAAVASSTLQVSSGGWTDQFGPHPINDGWTGILYSGSGVFTCQETGLYEIELGRNWDSGSARRLLFIWVNETSPSTGNQYRRHEHQLSSPVTFPQVMRATAYLVAGDTFKVGWYQTSGATLGATTTGAFKYGANQWSHYLQIKRVG